MNLEKSILDRIRQLPVEKRKAVLAFVESMQEAKTAVKEEVVLSADDQLSHWKDWVQDGPQGPLDEDISPEFP